MRKIFTNVVFLVSESTKHNKFHRRLRRVQPRHDRLFIGCLDNCHVGYDQGDKVFCKSKRESSFSSFLNHTSFNSISIFFMSYLMTWCIINKIPYQNHIQRINLALIKWIPLFFISLSSVQLKYNENKK